MKQILYVSTSVPATEPVDVARILEQSRHNNAIDGVTGLLWTDGHRFLQVIEGPEESVDLCFARIVNDPRHHDISVLSARDIDTPEFGYWTMEHRTADDRADAFDTRVRLLLQDAAPEVRAPFLSLIATLTAA